MTAAGSDDDAHCGGCDAALQKATVGAGGYVWFYCEDCDILYPGWDEQDIELTPPDGV